MDVALGPAILIHLELAVQSAKVPLISEGTLPVEVSSLKLKP